MSDRIYSEEEVALLIRRAVELEAERSRSGSNGDQQGLTMQDLEKIAADSGIDPELMRHAADELQNDVSPRDIEDTTTVNKTEIVAEHWINGEVTPRILDNLITELNHRFGTSQEEIGWLNRLFDDYSGKALVNKTPTSADWKYYYEFEMYTTRALIQQRGNKLRIRVSKRQAWNMSWNSEGLNIFIALFSALLFTTIGGVLGFALLESPLMGGLGGLALTALFVPATIFFSKRKIKQHKQEVTEIAENLVIQAKQMVKELNVQTGSESRTRNTDTGVIELDPDDKNTEANTDTSGRLRNHLRE